MCSDRVLACLERATRFGEPTAKGLSFHLYLHILVAIELSMNGDVMICINVGKRCGKSWFHSP